MLGINKIILIGNLGKDPELRYTPNGQAVVNFSIATAERWADKNGQSQDRTEWHNITVWGKLGVLANQYLRKGSRAYIEGKITTQHWNDKDGTDKYKTVIVANTIQFLDNKPNSNIAQTQSDKFQENPFEKISDQTTLTSPNVNNNKTSVVFVEENDLPF